MFALSVAFYMGATMAAGFSCNNPSVLAERIICSDTELGALDVDLNKAYQSALRAASSASQPALIREQRNWLTYTRNSCEDANCLKKAYTARIALLRKNLEWIVNDSAKYVTVDNQQRIVVFHRDPNEEVGFFNKKLSQKGDGHLTECHRLVALPVGYANSDETYGAYCTMATGEIRKPVTICADKFLGHLLVENSESSEDTDMNLIEFTSRNCFGG